MKTIDEFRSTEEGDALFSRSVIADPAAAAASATTQALEDALRALGIQSDTRVPNAVTQVLVIAAIMVAKQNCIEPGLLHQHVEYYWDRVHLRAGEESQGEGYRVSHVEPRDPGGE